ncbi:class F sortase [Nocardioides sp. SR21]|uniref:class F sortase n=1 Tax=Nocardioides sp. SR21 TaxID=2919501 RepID=UPI001FAB353A|nr:class F sortase [Nocardioides sp. SR21]
MRSRRLTSPVLVLVLGMTACATGTDGDSGGTPPAADRSLDAGAAQRAGAPPAEPPASVRLPSGTVVPVSPAGTTRNGLLDVPRDIAQAGWWPGGSKVGDPFGSTLLAGHVDAVDQGYGAFAELLEVRAGQRIRLRSRHLQQVFTVESRWLVPRDGLADADRIFSVRGARRLTLVTCAPPYVAGDGGYQNLAVVTAVAADDVHRRGRT